MKNNFTQALLAGIVGTVVMTLFMMLGAAMGMPKMEPPKMLADQMGTSIAIGWVLHFMVGIIFALIYVYLFRGLVIKVSSDFIKGVLFGILAVIIAQVGMMLMGLPMPEEGMITLVIASLIGHIVFGVTVALIAKPTII